MEIAKLEAIITGDVKPLLSSLDQAEAGLTEFAHTGDRTFLNLNASLSKTAQVALAAGTDIKSLTLALDVLQKEQSGIIRGTTLWQLYETEIKKVNAQLDVLEAQLPVVTAESNKAAIAGGGIGKSLTGAFSSLRQIAYILPGIGIAGIFNLAFEAIRKAAEELDLFNSQTKELAETNRQAIESYSDEANKVSILVAQLRDENTTRQEKQRIIDELQKIAPAYFGNLELEGDKVANLTDDYAKYGQAILLVAKIKGASDLNQKNVTAQIEEQLHTSERLALLEQKRAYAEKGGVNVEDQKLAILEDQLEAQTKLAQLSKPLLDIIIEAQKELAALGGDPGKPSPAAENINKITKAAKDLSEAFKTIRDNQISIIDNNQKIVETFVGNAAGIKPTNFKVNTEGFDEFLKRLDAAKVLADELSGIFVNLFEGIASGKNAFKELGHEIIHFIGTLIKAAIEAAILRAILSFIPGGAAAGPGLLGQLLGLLGAVPKLAGGGVVNSPTLAVVGESGPEAVIPLNQLSNLAVNNSQNIIVTGRISGSDIVLVQNRQNQRNNRNYGLNFN